MILYLKVIPAQSYLLFCHRPDLNKQYDINILSLELNNVISRLENCQSLTNLTWKGKLKRSLQPPNDHSGFEIRADVIIQPLLRGLYIMTLFWLRLELISPTFIKTCREDCTLCVCMLRPAVGGLNALMPSLLIDVDCNTRWMRPWIISSDQSLRRNINMEQSRLILKIAFSGFFQGSSSLPAASNLTWYIRTLFSLYHPNDYSKPVAVGNWITGSPWFSVN